jgi:hypothetical protein
MSPTPRRGRGEEHEERVQQLYARWLDGATRMAFAAVLLAFLTYVTGVLPPFVPLDALPALWGLPVDEYLQKTGDLPGWGWLRLLGFSDHLSLASVALIGLVTLLCYLRILPLLLRLGERLQAVLVLAQILVLLTAASGLLAGRH